MPTLNIVTAMGKLTILVNTAIENQVLAIDLAELILSWEVKSNELKKKSKMQESAGTVAASDHDDMSDDDNKTLVVSVVLDKTADYDFGTSENYAIPFGQREACVTCQC